MQANGLEKDMMLMHRRGKKEEKSSKEEVDGGNTHGVRDEPGGAEGCGEKSGLCKRLTMAVARINRDDSTR